MYGCAVQRWFRESFLNLALLPIDSRAGRRGQGCEREDGAGHAGGLEAGSPRGHSWDWGALQLWQLVRAWTCAVQAWKRRDAVCVCKAAMHFGIVFESCAVADRFPRVEVQATKEKAVLGNQEHSELEVRGGNILI